MSVSIKDDVLNANFGDKRLDERLGTIAEEFASHPNGSIPGATTGRAEMEAAYRFFDNDNDKVTPDKIVESHFQATQERIAQHDLVLLMQDTTELDLTRPEQQVRATGPMDSEARRGAFLHPLEAFDLNGIPLGMVWQKSWTGDEVQTELTKAEKNKKRWETPIEDKESIRWVAGIQASREVAKVCPRTPRVCVGDSESDIYKLLSESRVTPDNNLQLLIRDCQIRATTD